MPHYIDVPGHGIVEFPDGMSDDDITAAIQKNLPAAMPAKTESKPYSLGPISDLAELGARGINAAAQSLPEIIRPEFRQPQPMGQPVNLPFIGQPSLAGMAQGAAKGVVSGATLPGDVYAGKVDPLSPEGIARTQDLAGLIQLPITASPVQRAATAPLTSEQIREAGAQGYRTLTSSSRSIPVPKNALDNIRQDVRNYAAANGPSPARAEAAYKAMNIDARQPTSVTIPVGPQTAKDAMLYGTATPGKQVFGDVGDLIDTRRNLMDVVRNVGGDEGRAAQMAVNRLDPQIERLAPGLVNKLQDADKNFAISHAAKDAEDRLDKAVTEGLGSGTGGNVGNKIRQAFEKLNTSDAYLSPAQKAAVEATANPGKMVGALRPLAAFDPTHSKLATLFAISSLGFSPKMAALYPSGYAARAAYDAIMKNRAANVSRVMRSEAPATLAAPGYTPSGIVAYPNPTMTPSGILPLMSQDGTPYYLPANSL